MSLRLSVTSVPIDADILKRTFPLRPMIEERLFIEKEDITDWYRWSRRQNVETRLSDFFSWHGDLRTRCDSGLQPNLKYDYDVPDHVTDLDTVNLRYRPVPATHSFGSAFSTGRFETDEACANFHNSTSSIYVCIHQHERLVALIMVDVGGHGNILTVRNVRVDPDFYNRNVEELMFAQVAAYAQSVSISRIIYTPTTIVLCRQFIEGMRTRGCQPVFSDNEEFTLDKASLFSYLKGATVTRRERPDGGLGEEYVNEFLADQPLSGLRLALVDQRNGHKDLSTREVDDMVNAAHSNAVTYTTLTPGWWKLNSDDEWVDVTALMNFLDNETMTLVDALRDTLQSIRSQCTYEDITDDADKRARLREELLSPPDTYRRMYSLVSGTDMVDITSDTDFAILLCNAAGELIGSIGAQWKPNYIDGYITRFNAVVLERMFTRHDYRRQRLLYIMFTVLLKHCRHVGLTTIIVDNCEGMIDCRDLVAAATHTNFSTRYIYGGREFVSFDCEAPPDTTKIFVDRQPSRQPITDHYNPEDLIPTEYRSMFIRQ